MDTEPNDPAEMQDQALNEALESPAAEDLDGLSIQDRRLAKVDEYEDAALSRADTFAAMIGIGNASLQRVFEHLGAALLGELDSRAHTLEEIREYRPEIGLMVKLRKSIETDLEFHFPDAGQQGAAFSRRIQNGLDNKVATRKRELLPKRWMDNR